MQLTSKTIAFLIGTAALLPLLGLAAWLWRRFYRDDERNTARRVLKNSALPIVATLINKVVDLGFAAITLRAIGQAGNGAYALATTIVGLYLVTITNWGLNDLTVREVAADHARAPRLFSITLLLRGLLTLASVPLAAAIAGAYLLIDNPLSDATLAALAILVLHLLPSALAAACSASFQAFQRMEIPASIALVTNVLKVLLGTLMFLLVPGVVGRVIGLAVLALLITSFNALVFFALQQRLLFRFRLEWDWPAARGLLREAFPLMLNSLLLGVFFKFDSLILRGYGTDAVVGAYDAAYKWIGMTQIVPPYFVAALFPVLARHAANDRPALLRTYRQAAALLQLLAWPLAVGVMLLAPQLIVLLGGATYLPAASRALAILIWYLPLSYFNGVTQYVLIALRRQRYISIAFGIAALANVLLNLVLIGVNPAIGYIYAAGVTVATEAVLLMPFVTILRREGALLPIAALMWRPALAALLMGAAMLAVYTVGPPGLLAALVATPVYVAALWALGAFGADERALVRRVLGRA